ncbi:PREDICTED: polyubiquitin 9-like [Nelumbo nucifera]|uniref:Polyubiquitin 9-like n=1 Tax=Nelumbo nucifera TaxID=4432 RepID=A0A1U7Z946_NELNU|nr:PREDICTED: polyubiquitin 9-like [Nelumbo nucifera]
MDVTFEIPKGKQFTIEVGFFDTVIEIKEKINKYQGIPVSKQTLVFNGKVMADDKNTEFYEVLQGSRIQLKLEPESAKTVVKVEESVPSTKVQLRIRVPPTKKQYSLGMDVNDSVGQLKEKIQELEEVPASRLVLLHSDIQLQVAHRSLGDYGLSDLSEVTVIFKPSPPPTTTSAGGNSVNSKKLKLLILPKCGTKKIQIEVNPSDNVGELRKELQRLHQNRHFHLPSEGYFFIYKQNVMDDDRSFRWHNVRQGDTIEIFNGSVTGGS